MTKYLFIGECPSATAIAKGYCWRDGRLAAKQLFEALRFCGLDPDKQEYCNLFQSRSDGRFYLKPFIMFKLSNSKSTLVAMGNMVSKRLIIASIKHRKIVHPAARGRIRLKLNYFKHVQSVLQLG